MASIKSILEQSLTGEPHHPSQNENKDGLVAALDAIALDEGQEERKSTEENADTPDDNGLVYLTYTITVDPTKYVSGTYKPKANTKLKDAASLKKVSKASASARLKMPTEEPPKGEPTSNEEKDAARQADNEKEEMLVETETVETSPDKKEKTANDEAVVFDYSTACDGTSFMCYDEGMAIDYSHIAMDTTPRRAVTRETCQTTFAQCRAENPLFCRYHGPKLLEADIKTALRGHLGRSGISLSITRDRNAQNPMTFRVTIGCRPDQRAGVEQIMNRYFHDNPGITSQDTMHDTDRGKMTQEFEMDIMRADRPPRGAFEQAMAEERDLKAENGGTMATVGETPERRPARARRPRPAPRETPPTPQEPVAQTPAPSPAPSPAPAQEPAQEPSPEPPPAQAETTPPRQTPAEGNVEATSPQNARPIPQPSNAEAPEDNGIEHLDGGIKARFSPSEVQAIETEMGRAQRASSENPNDAELRGYAHALSHFLGSANSRYGRAHNALRGIRDGITKAELLDKAEARLAATANADNPARYDGSVRALNKIAEIAGLHGLDIDGSRVSLQHPDQDGANGVRPNREAPVEQPPSPPVQEGVPTEEEIDEVARQIAESQFGRERHLTAGNISAQISARVNGNTPTSRRWLTPLMEANVIPEDNPVMQALQARMTATEAQTGATPTPNPTPAPTPTPPPAEPSPSAARVRPTDEQIEDAIRLVVNGTGLRGYEPSIRSILRSAVNTGNISRTHAAYLNTIPADHPVRRYLDHNDDTEVPEPAVAPSDDEEISALKERMRETPGGECTAEELRSIRNYFRTYELNHNYTLNGEAAKSMKEAVDESVRETDDATNASTGVNAGKIRSFSPTNVTTAPSNGCNCWKTVAAAILRMRGYSVVPRGSNEPSPVFADTMAVGGQQRLTYYVSQSAMAQNYEKVVEESVTEAGGPEDSSSYINNRLSRLARGWTDENGVSHLPYPDGTAITCWNGGHCTGLLLNKGSWFSFDPWGGPGLRHIGVDLGHNTGRITTGTDTYMLRVSLEDYRRRKAANPSFHYDSTIPDQAEKKVAVAQFMMAQRRVLKTKMDQWKANGEQGPRPTVSSIQDDEVLDACQRDKEWMKFANSYIILPTQPIIKEMWGLAKRT